MPIEKLFKDAVEELRKRELMFAVAGGLAADLYRDQPRLTMDVDLSIVTEANAKDAAVSVVESIGLTAGISRKADLDGGPLFAIRKKSTPPWIVVGRPEGKPDAEGVDVLLPAIPWVRNAVNRAQANEADFGFGAVPVLTLEDVILSKLYALNAARLRAKDLDDLQSISAAGHDIDEAYLAGQIQQLQIKIPRDAKPFLSKSLLNVIRDSRGGES